MINNFRKLVRLEQWYKNLLIFLPLLFAPTHLLYHWQQLIIGFIGFCFISSITYIINDWMDREKDRIHPVKKNRPLASGAITGKQAIWVVILLALIVIGISIYLGIFYSSLIIIYFIYTNAYSLGLKNIPILDIFMVTINFIFRTLAGVTAFPPQETWPYFLLIFSVIFIMLTHKRRSDIKIAGDKAISHKPVLKFYSRLNCYLLRVMGYVVLGYSFYQFWQRGLSLIIMISLIILFIVTSVIFSRKPMLVMKPHYLLKVWYWDVVLVATAIIIIVSGHM